MDDETPFYYGYIRYSRKEQREGDSLPRQLAHHESRSSQLGARWIDEYRDEGVSSYRGRNLTHGDLGRFFDDVRTGKIRPGAILGVENQDRLGRLPAHLILPVIFNALALGVVLDIRGRSLTQQLIDDQPHLLYEVLGEAIRSNEESRRKGDFPRKRNARKRKEAHQGKRKFDGKRHVPWVMPNPDGTEEYVEHPERAGTVREIFRLVDTLGYGGTRIARRFHDPNNRVDSFTPSSNTWHPGYINALLRNRAVLGEWQPMIRDKDGRKVPDPDGVVEDWYPRVVDEDVFERVQLVLDKNNTNPGGERGGNRGGGRMGPHFANLFFQMGKCAECGQSLILNWHTRRDGSRACYLRCSWSRKKKCTNTTGYSYPIFEKQFLHLERHMIAHTNAGLPAPTANADHNLLVSLNGELNAKEASMLRMMQRFADETDPARRDAAEKVMDGLSRQIAALKEKIAKERREARAFEHDDPFYNKRMNALHAKLNSTDPKERTETRAAINKELKRRVDRMWLRPDRSMVIRINDGRRNLTVWESVIDPVTIRSVRLLDRHDALKVLMNLSMYPRPWDQAA
jgi:hypothetical protein